ncbi:tape measure protein [Nisaea sp.]|uniref:tape measure protein n=1 Tax=Nisaea sp. TaxID=2024842 RepID=UPI00329A0200
MAQSLEDLLIQIDASTEKLRRELKRGDASVKDFDRKVDRSLGNIDGRFDRLAKNTTRAMAGVVAAFGTREILRFARDTAIAGDNVDLMRARLTNLTRNSLAFDKLADSADRLGITIEAASGSVGRFAVAGRAVGLTTDEVIKLNEVVTQLGRIGGGSMMEINAASIQLAQGLASGRLSGDELRSVMEQMPLVAERIAASLGVGVGQLRKMGSEGKLTADVVSGALLGSAEDVQAQFDELPRTMLQFEAATSNAFTLFQSELSKATAASEGFKSIYDGIAGALENAATNLRSVRGFLNDDSETATLGDLQKSLQASRDRAQFMRDAGADYSFNPIPALGFEGLVSPGYALALREIHEAGIAVTEMYDRMRAKQAAADEVAKSTEETTTQLSKTVQGFVDRLRLEADGIEKTDLQREIAVNLRRAETTAATALGKEIVGLTEEIYREEAAVKAQTEAMKLLGKAAEDELAGWERASEYVEDKVRERDNLVLATEREVSETYELVDALKVSDREYRVVMETQKLLRQSNYLTADAARDLAEKTIVAAEELQRIQESSSYLSDSLGDVVDVAGDFVTGIAQGTTQLKDFGNVGEAVLAKLIEQSLTLAAINPFQNMLFGTTLPTLGTVASTVGGTAAASGGASGFRLPSFGLGGIGNSIVTSSLGETLGLSAFDVGVGDLLPTALGEAFSGGLSATPYGIVGSVLGQMLGLGSGNTLLDAGLGAAGSFAGGAAGAALIGGAFGGPVGAILGSLAGSAIGSLFEDEDYPFAKGDVNLSGGGLSFTTDSLDDGDEGGAAQLTQAVVAGLEGFLASSGGALTGDLNQIATIGYASGRSDALGHGFFAGGAGDFATGADFTNLEDSGLAVALSIRQGILKAIDEGTLEGVSQEYMDAVSTGIRNSATDNAEQLAADIDFSIFYGQIIDGIEEPLTAVELSFQSLADQTEAAKEQAERLGLALEPVAEHFAELTAEAVRAVEADLERQIRSLTGHGYLNTLEDIVAAYDFNAKSAAAAGIGTDKIDRLFSLQVSNALSGVDGVDHGRVADVLAQAGVNLPAAALYDAQYHATLDQIEALKANTDATDDVARRFLAIADSRLTDERFSPLDPRARIDAAREELDRLLGLATDGTDDPETRDALQRIEAADAAFLEASIAYYGKAGGYWDDFNYSQDALRQIANDNFSVADRQLTELQQANTHLGHLATIIESLGGTVPGGATGAASGSTAGGAAVAATGSVSGNVVTLPNGITDTAANLTNRMQAYLDRYPDLQAAFGSGPTALSDAFRHYNEFGAAEGRTFHTGGYPVPGEMFRALPGEILVQAPAAGQMRVLDPKQSADYRSKSEIVAELKNVRATLDVVVSVILEGNQRNAASQRAIAAAVEKGSDAQEILAAYAERSVA